MKPYFHSQNLNEDRQQNIIGSMFWHGRAWYRAKREWTCEWSFGRRARGFHVKLKFGGDGGRALLILGIPFLFDLYLGTTGLIRLKKEVAVGIAIHDQGLWIDTFSTVWEINSSDPWWKKGLHWSFPWSYDWHSTEVLKWRFCMPFETVWKETRASQRADRKNGRDIFESMREQEKAEATVTEEYDYTYVRKHGEVQKRKAKVHVERRVWRMRWWPLLPFSKSRTSIDVAFNEEVGEGTGSWKGGTVGCGYDMLPGETPYATLRRMERERKFDR